MLQKASFIMGEYSFLSHFPADESITFLYTDGLKGVKDMFNLLTDA